MKRILLILCLFAPASMTLAQTSWSLEKCIQTAVRNNLTIKNMDLSMANSSIDLRQAREARYPSLNGSVGMNLNFGRSIDPTTNEFIQSNFFSNNYSVSTGVLLYNGNRVNNAIKQARLNYQNAQLNKEQVERDIALNVATLFLNVLFTRENIRIAENNYASAEASVEQMLKLIQSGSRAEGDRYSLEAQLATNAQALVAAKNAYDIAVLQLKQAMLLDPNEDFEIQEMGTGLEIFSDPDLLTVDDLYISGLRNQKSVQAAEVNVRSAELGIKLAEASLLPRVTIGGSLGSNYSNRRQTVLGFDETYEFQTVLINNQEVEVGFPAFDPRFGDIPYSDQLSENLSYGFGMNISIPIYNNYANSGSIERARLNRESMLIQLEQQKQGLFTSVQQALADARASKASLEAAERSKKAQELAYLNARKRFEIDAIGVFELTNLKELYENSEINYLIAKYDYIFRTKVLDFYLGKPIKLK